MDSFHSRVEQVANKLRLALPDDLFPLPLTPFEQYLLLDDQPLHPMTFFVEMVFSTPIDIERITESIKIVLHRNPLLASKVVTIRGKEYWSFNPDISIKVSVSDDDRPIVEDQILQINLRKEIGCRFWYRTDSNTYRLLIQFHHACTDGNGARRFILETMAVYAQIAETGKEDLPTYRMDRIEFNLLKDRFKLESILQSPAKHKISTWQRLKNLHYFYFQQPTPLVSYYSTNRKQGFSIQSNGNGESENPLPPSETFLPANKQRGVFEPWPIESFSLDKDITVQIFERTKSLNLNLNDLSLAILFRTCQRWNDKAKTGKNHRIRLLMPYDLRTRIDLKMPASNCMSYAFLGRTANQCCDWQTLLESVCEETQYIKDTQLYADFLTGLKTAVRFPRLMRWTVKRSRNMATVAMTYVGDVLRGSGRFFKIDENGAHSHDATLIQLLAAPPTRSNTRLSLGLCTIQDKLIVTAAWNRREWTVQDCHAFLSDFRAAWVKWGQTGIPD